MSDNSSVETGEAKKKAKYFDKVVPTLFIGVGGTGAQVLWRVRRRILSKVWTGGPQALRLDSLDQFPFAQFFCIDLDSHTFGTASRSDDPMQSAVSFKPKERNVNKLDLGKYFATDESLRSFPLIEEWFPLTSQKLAELNINPDYGAGQIRAISRLYFYDKYQEIKSAIQQALASLRNNVDNAEQNKDLGLTLDPHHLRVVVVASTAGGTGSGAFIDMGYLSKVLLKASGASSITNQLVLMLPSGYAGFGSQRQQANTYGALMELETCMRGGASHISKWSESDIDFTLPMTPYDDVYLLDAENLAGAKATLTGCFEMAADVLFEDISAPDFAARKRSFKVSQDQYKVSPYSSRVDRSKYGDLKLMFSRAYSAFGQVILEVQKNEERGHLGKELGEENPLFSALDELSPSDRQQRLSQVMQRAMPWAALKLDGYLEESEPGDQYKCVVGVKDSVAFENRYGKDILNAIPSSSKMPAQQVQFVEISEPGRLVCYVELSGFPLPAFKEMDEWYESYKQESRIPVNTHKSIGKFVHARELSAAELSDRKVDLELVIKAMALGALERSNKKHNVGALIFKNNGVQRSIGEEKSIRLNSLEIRERGDLTEKVQELLAKLQSPDQLSLWWALMVFHRDHVYPTRVVLGDDLKDQDEQHLPTMVCTELAEKAEALLKKAVPDEVALRQLKDRASEQLREWSEEIVGSQDDPYRHEINQKREDGEDPDSGAQPKRVLKEAVFDQAWRLRVPGDMPPWGGAVMPPTVMPPVVSVSWHLSVGGQTYGPYPIQALQAMIPTRQFTAATLVWRAGMVTWASAGSLSELSGLFYPSPVVGLPSPPPPPPPPPPPVVG